MEIVWYSVLFFILINQVFAIDRNCWSLEDITSCDECVRCNGNWCNDPKESPRCVGDRGDSWCPDGREPSPSIKEETVPGQFFSHRFRTKTVNSGTDQIEVTFPSKTENPKMTIFSNTTQEPFDISNSTYCKGGVCTLSVVSQPTIGFCKNDGRVEEFYTIVLKVEGSDEELVLRNHVACACYCSSNVEILSQRCSGRGNFSCGTCDCEKSWHGEACELPDSEPATGTVTESTKGTPPGATKGTATEAAKGTATEATKGSATEATKGTGTKTSSFEHNCNSHGSWREGKCHCNEPWHGEFCQQRDTALDFRCKGHGIWSDGKCHCHGHWSGEFCDTCSTRGDIAMCSSSNLNDDVGDCYGHGTCECGCVCYNNTIGSRYFDHNNYCEDICRTISNDCDTCAKTSQPGKCDECRFPLSRLPYVESRMEERDELNRDMWVRCNDTINDCEVEYAAMRDDAGETFIMVIKSCDAVSAPITGPVSVTVPILLGVLLPLVSVLSAVGFYLWKNRTPPHPLTDPMYQNIDAEDCTGENPLYKPPTSSFKNPTYGKWQ